MLMDWPPVEEVKSRPRRSMARIRASLYSNVVLPVGERFARRDQQLRFDDIDAGDQLGDRMFHLHPQKFTSMTKPAVLRCSSVLALR